MVSHIYIIFNIKHGHYTFGVHFIWPRWSWHWSMEFCRWIVWFLNLFVYVFFFKDPGTKKCTFLVEWPTHLLFSTFCALDDGTVEMDRKALSGWSKRTTDEDSYPGQVCTTNIIFFHDLIINTQGHISLFSVFSINWDAKNAQTRAKFGKGKMPLI